MRYKRSARRYAEQFARRFFEALGVAAAMVGAIAVFAPELLVRNWWIICAVIGLAVGWGLFRLRQRQPRQQFRENVTIRIVEGDLFTQNASALVGMTTTFDTAVPDVIASESVQGSFLRTIFNGSHTTLDAALSDALQAVTPTGSIGKPGKNDVYPIGTVAVLHGQGAIRYYCVAYATMDTHNRASGTVRGILDSLDNVWDAVDKFGNGDPICVPLVGQGQSRVPELTAEVAVRLIAISFLLRTRRSRFSSELRIVIHPNEIGKIDLTEFQAFLQTLAAA